MASFDVDQVLFEFLDVTPDPSADAVIVLSRHESASGRPSLTVHYTGNAGAEAQFGGKPGELSYAASDVGLELLKAYHASASSLGLLSSYSLSYEATHHGPTSNMKPLVFIEIGSSEAQWSDPRALRALVDAVLYVLENGVKRCEPVVGVGSTHYPSNFTKLALEMDTCFGHILSKHALKALAPGVLEQAIDKSSPGGARGLVVDAGSLNSRSRSYVMSYARSRGLNVSEIGQNFHA